MRRNRNICFSFAILALASMAFSAHAEPPNAPAAAAEALFLEGKALLAQKKFTEACPKLVESQRLDAGTGTLLTLALCHEGEGKIATAWAEFQEARSQARVAGRQDRIAMANEHIASLEPSLSYLVIRAEQRAAIRIVRDGEAVGEGALGVEIPVDPGAHIIEASASGKQTWTQQISVTPERRVFEVRIPALASAVAVAEAQLVAETVKPADEHVSAARLTAYAIGGTGIAAMCVGGIFGLQAISKSQDAKGRCPAGLCDDPAALAENDDARSAAVRSNVFIGAGSALVLAGAILWFTQPSTSTQGLSASVGPHAGSIRWSGHF